MLCFWIKKLTIVMRSKEEIISKQEWWQN